MQEWEWLSINQLGFITIPDWLKQGVDIAFSLRRGGLSAPPFSSLNMGLHVGDDKRAVIGNRRLLVDLFAADLNKVVCCEQIHGNQVAVIDNSYAGCGALAYSDALRGYDAMITNQTNLYLMCFFADCIPIFFFDPLKRVIGLAHSGWKGTVGRIALNTINKMQDIYNCSVKSIQAFIGPGINNCCFEIDSKLAKIVAENFKNHSEFVNKKGDKIYWDLPATNHGILLEAGIKAENITQCNLCTSCHTDRFFSYRAEKGSTGRMAALLALKS